MGVNSPRVPPLPAPTETDSNTGGTELESRVTEKSTYSLPSDGSPVTISTKKRDKGLSSNKSQTSLLIEYFEGGKGSQTESRRPSVRVKVTPSSKSRSRSANDHIQITERKGTRKSSYTKRIHLSSDGAGEKAIEGEGEGEGDSAGSYRSATEESNVTSRGGGPIEVEIMPRRHGSPLIPSTERNAKYVQINASEISSLPADSFLDGKSPERKRSRSLSRGELLAAGAATGLATAAVADKLRTPSRRRSRSLSRERIVAQKAVEKVRGEKGEKHRKHRSRDRSVSGEQTESIKSPRRRSSRSHHEESIVSGTDPSLLNSQTSKRSGDQYSFRSTTSKTSSINNPKLLETVEDAIRRLILPELTALKREQSKHSNRERDRRGSLSTASGLSRESRDETSSGRRLSDRGSSIELSNKPKFMLNDEELISGNSLKGRRDKNLDRIKLEDFSRGEFEREASEDTVIQDDSLRKKRSSDKQRLIEEAAAGTGLGALTIAALHKHQSQDSIDEKKERRRRRAKSRSRTDSLAESYEDDGHQEVPQMPLMSEINASELTRTSILSAETERPHSASQEHIVSPIREVPRGYISPAQQTPTKTPNALQQGLGTQHSNFSRGNLSLHSDNSQQQLRVQEYEIDEHGRKVPMHGDIYEDSYVEEDHNGGNDAALDLAFAGTTAGAGLGALHNYEENHEDPELTQDDYYYYQNHQEVPPPLRYVPYGHERRGLSPIQSVSGYTEGDPELPLRDSRLTQSSGSFSSVGESAQHKQSGRSMRSLDSTGKTQNRHDFVDVRHGGLTDSELTQDGEYVEEQHQNIDQDRGLHAQSRHSSDPRIDYKHMTNYTDDSIINSELAHIATGQNVKGLGANPDYVHTPIAVESAVASLVNESELTTESRRYDRRGSNLSYEDGSERHFTSRGNSPTKREADRDLQHEGSDAGSAHQSNLSSKFAEEYEIDEQGRKVAMPKYENSYTVGKAGLTGIAAGAAAAVLAQRQNSEADQIHYEGVSERTGAPLHKSFKERALEGEGQIPSPRHSIDAPLSEVASHEQFKLGATGLPDINDPMPEIGHGYDDNESEVITNPSIINEPIEGGHYTSRDNWAAHPTPPSKQQIDAILSNHSPHSNADLKAAEAALIGAAAGAGGAAAVAGHSRELSQDDEWQRSSGERKRDTLVTNPYEGTSPIAPLDLDRGLLGRSSFPGINGNFTPTKLNYTGSPGALQKDEGYISAAPNPRSVGGATPEPRVKGVGFLDDEMGAGLDELGGDPFYEPKHSRHLSGMSHGMSSPIYDSATGNGIDRIQSKDIVALMDHLTVRDAQRSARDTEILVTLVRAAAEMRNSFEDMKRLLADTEDVIITEVQTNTDRSVQKAINGPRPLPQSTSRSLRQGSQDEMYDDIPTKRRNVFRRALKGLSLRSSNDLGKIEDMLVQLLGEVEGLKVAQGLKPSSYPAESYEDLQQEGNNEQDRGYEPEGNAGTSITSHASQSGHLSVPRTGSAQRGAIDARKFSDHRISTVPEGDEEDEIEIEPHEQAVLNNQFEQNELLLTPTREVARGGSVPLGTPPQQQQPVMASLSNENTPRTDKSKKHKSTSSSGWIPKVSRWSDTTTSTILRGFRSSGRKSGRKDTDQYAEQPSRSGSDLGNYVDHVDQANPEDSYENDKLHTGYSQEQLQQYEEAEPRSVIPPEDPKYKAHRNSLNLQHPQPRPGPTHRYQTALESQAVDYDSPMSPKSVDFGSQLSLNRLPPQQQNRYSNTTNNTMTPVSDGAYYHASEAPTRPPKDPIVPEIPPKVRKLGKPSPLSKEHLNSEDYGSGSGDSPRSAARSSSGALGVPSRKPTGPRSMSAASKNGDREEGLVRRENRDTFGTLVSTNSAESETF